MSAHGPVWVCDRCGYKSDARFAITVTRGESSHACDSCGGELVCSACYDHPEFCDCPG